MVIGSSLSSLFVLFFYSEQSKNQIYLMNLVSVCHNSWAAISWEMTSWIWLKIGGVLRRVIRVTWDNQNKKKINSKTNEGKLKIPREITGGSFFSLALLFSTKIF